MKKTLLFFIAIFFGLSVSGQSGDGRTPATAYYGTINTTIRWTVAYNGGTIYVGQGSGNEDLTIGGSGFLTIDPGVTVVFCTQTTDLTISGQLSAGGSGSPVTFTRYFPTFNYWGHIFFTSAAVSSTLTNCIIEYGDVTRNTGVASYGGGIYADNNILSITNCIIRNNRAEWGGGIFVNQFRHPAVSNCYFLNNFSNQGGGGIYLWNYASSVIQNCVFDSNHCNGTSASWYTGGGLGTQSYCSVKVLNCTFVNNSSSRSIGQSIMFYSSINDIAINCIVWGPGTQYYLSGTNSNTYCAVQGAAPTGTGNFVLNASNTAVDGPNFVDPTNKNYAITILSPCRNSGASIGVPVTDILGRTRGIPYDIGAYEFVSISWKLAAATTDWNNAANWDGGVPTGASDILIPSGATNYPISTPAPDFTLGAGNSMLLGPGAKATLGNLVNNGTLTLQSDATGISSLICTSYTGNDANVQLFLPGGAGTFGPKYHYISSPFTSLSASPITSQTLDLAQWVESLASPNLLIGWVAYDGFVYRVDPPNPPYTGPTFSSLISGKGYNHYKSADYLYTLQGQLNTSDVTCNLNYTVKTPDAPTQYGLNLLGNPFSSGLDWDQIANNGGYPTNTSKYIYFNRSGTIVYYVNGVGSDVGVTGIIPPMQGFFTKTYSSGNSIVLPASARVNVSIPNRYKKGESVIPLVRINLSSDGYNDNTVVRFDNAAKTGMDYDFDAPKLFLDPAKPYIYSVSGVANFAINGQPFPDSTLEIPLVVNIPTTGDNTLSSTQLQGLDNYAVTLTDKTTGLIADLKTNMTLTFSATAGVITDRFVIKVEAITTGIENPKSSTGIFNIYSSFGTINIQTLSDEWDGKEGSVRIIDLSGKTVKTLDNTSFSKNSLITIPAAMNNGIYFVEIKSGIKKYVGKGVIR